MPPRGQFCSVGSAEEPKPLFYYASHPHLLIEKIDRRNRNLRHLVMLVDEHGKPVALPPGCRFEHVTSMEETNLLDNHLRAHG